MRCPTALIVDDDDGFRESLGALVSREGFSVRLAAGLDDARRLLKEEPSDVVLVDLGLPDGDGGELLQDEETASASDFVVITGNATVESAVQALQGGALDYLTKPLDRARLKTILANVTRSRGLRRQIESLRSQLLEFGRFGPLVGRSAAMQRVYELISRVAPTRASVMITGESGTGKELVAETIHQLSKRAEGPFLAVNCGAVTPGVMESELFGHEKGSFTGAERSRRGYFEQADGGTLLLDEITEMPVELQVKLLRVLETGEFLRVGSSVSVQADVRVVAATNRDPAKAVQDGVLREDLYYRLSVFPIAVPPLRDRGEDVELLAEHFLAAVNQREATKKTWSGEARERLRAYPWPGNVRELRNAVERAAILADSVIPADALPAGQLDADAPGRAGPVLQLRIGSSLDEMERRAILATLGEVGGDKKRAAELLGISLKTLYNRLNVYEAAGRTTAPAEPPR